MDYKMESPDFDRWKIAKANKVPKHKVRTFTYKIFLSQSKTVSPRRFAISPEVTRRFAISPEVTRRFAIEYANAFIQRQPTKKAVMLCVHPRGNTTIFRNISRVDQARLDRLVKTYTTIVLLFDFRIIGTSTRLIDKLNPRNWCLGTRVPPFNQDATDDKD